MATWGALNNTTNAGFAAAPSGLEIIGSIPSFPGGTITAVNLFLKQSGFDDNANKYRLAIYLGGTSDTDPDGATLQLDLGVIATPYPASAGAGDWMRPTCSVVVAAGRLWLIAKGNYSIQMGLVDGADAGNCNGNMLTLVGQGNDDAVAFTSPIGSTGPINDGGHAYKWYVTYTAAGGAIPVLMNSIRQRVT